MTRLGPTLPKTGLHEPIYGFVTGEGEILLDPLSQGRSQLTVGRKESIGPPPLPPPTGAIPWVKVFKRRKPLLMGYTGRGLPPTGPHPLLLPSYADPLSLLLDPMIQGFGRIIKVVPRIIFPSPATTFVQAVLPEFPITVQPAIHLGGKASAAVTPNTLRTIISARGEDSSLFTELPPGKNLSGKASGAAPLPPRPGAVNRPQVFKRRRPIILTTAGVVNAPIGLHNAFEAHVPDELELLLYNRMAVALLFGGKPPRNITPQTLRQLLVGAPPDESILADPRSSPGPYTIGGKPNRPITPSTVRNPLVVTAEDMAPFRVWDPILTQGGQPHTSPSPVAPRKLLYQFIDESFLLDLRPAKVSACVSVPRTVPTLREVLLAKTEDLFTPQIGPSTLLWTRPVAIGPPQEGRGKPILIVMAEDTFSLQPWPPSLRMGGQSSRSITPQTLRQAILVRGDEEIAIIPLATATLYGGKPFIEKTHPSLRTLLLAQTEDLLSPLRIPPGLLFGAQPFIRSVTPTSLRPIVPASIEDVFSLQRHAEAIILGGKPSRGVTQDTLRSPLLVLAEDVFSLQRHPEAILWGGLASAHVTRPTLPQVGIVLAEDVFSLLRHPEAFLFGGKPSKAATPSILRPPLWVPAEDVISPLAIPGILLHGPNLAGITNPTLRQTLVITAEDLFSLLKHPEAYIFGGHFGTVPVIVAFSLWGWIPAPREITWRVPGTETIWLPDDEDEWGPPRE